MGDGKDKKAGRGFEGRLESSRERFFRLERTEDLKNEASRELAERDDLLGAVFTSAMDGIFVIDAEGGYADVNPAGCRMFGYDREEFIGSDITLLLFPEDVESSFERLREARDEGVYIPEYRMRSKDGSEIWVEFTVTPFVMAGERYFLGIKRDITGRRITRRELVEQVHRRTEELREANRELAEEVAERKRAERVVHSIIEGISSVSGDRFFKSLVRSLASALGFRYAIVGELAEDSRRRVRTLAVWAGDGYMDNITYDLKGTPCAEVMGKNLCFYPRHIQERFPEDDILKDMGAESYLGVPLFDSSGDPLGILIALDDKPMPEDSLATKVMTIFASRAALELERAHLEEERRKTDELLQTMMDNAPVVAFIKDSDGRFLFVNSWYEEFLGMPREKVVGKHDRDIFPEETVERFRENDRKVLELGRPMHYEETVPLADGEHTYLVAKFPVPSMPGAVCGIATDITELKEASDELAASEKRLKDAQRIARVGAWEWDIREDVHYNSDEMVGIFGRSPGEEARGCCGYMDMVCPEDRARVEKALEAALAGKDGGRYSEEFRILHPDGAERFVHDRGEVEFGPHGEAVRMTGTVQDLTERRKTEGELARAQKLESLGEMAGGMAHEFNNLLLGILGNVSIARACLDRPAKVEKLLGRVENSAVRSKALTRQLLTFARGGAPVKELCRVDELIESTAPIVLKDSDVEYTVEVEPGLDAVPCDEGQLGQVISNVVLNAAQAASPGGEVRLLARNIEGGSVEPPLGEGGYVRFTVEDSGPGIPEGNVARIFDPFFTTREKASGLGLSVSYSIVKKHGGEIRVESSPGRGSAFHIYLPSSGGRDASAAASEPAGDMEKEEDGVRNRVLVMDDEEMVRDVASEMLDILGYEPDSADDGEEAIEKYRRAMEEERPYALVVMDLTIPGRMGGKEAIEELRKIDPDVRAVVSSGYSRDPIMSEYERYGFKGVIKKPYMVGEFSKAVQDVMAGED